MRKRKVIKLDDREITVKELTVREIIEIGDKITNQKESKSSGSDLERIKNALSENLTVGVEGVTVEEMIGMAPSEIDAIYKAFKEVNGVFFEIAKQVGLTQILTSMKDQLRTDFLRSLAA